MRKIIHIDMDSFYASVEMRDNPKLRNLPIAVGGKGKRGVLSTANYQARSFGVHSAMSTALALKRCPNLIVVPGRHHAYKEASIQVREIIKQYTETIQPLSLDEAYLDVTDSQALNNNATAIARSIRQEIYQKTKLTCSAGIAPNKFLAKIASDWKKPNGQFTIKPQDIKTFMPELDLYKIPGIGKVTFNKMKKLNLIKCKDMQKLTLIEIENFFGRMGRRYFELCRGIDQSEVSSNRVRKSMSLERTFSEDFELNESLYSWLEDLVVSLQKNLQKKNITESQVDHLFIKIKFNNFTIKTLERSQYQNVSLDNYKKLLNEISSKNPNRKIRLMGIGIKLKENKNSNQLSFLSFLENLSDVHLDRQESLDDKFYLQPYCHPMD
ncbi:DNA polymerase IV [Bacteriovoracaceae bacterium]|nr:DNA polymerase IV [Bacteriovoracaceae bacterium]